MKYTPKKVYVKENVEYIPLEYLEFCLMKESDETYAKKKFVPVQGCLLEVDEKTYKEAYKEYERNKYIRSLEIKNTVYRGESIESDDGLEASNCTAKDDLENVVIERVMISKLRKALQQLDAEESAIIDLIYYKGLSQRSAAEMLGITQSTLGYRIKKLVKKLEVLMKNRTTL